MRFPELFETTESQLIDRRGVLGTLGLAGLGVLATSAVSNAAPTDKAGPKVSVPVSAGGSAATAVRYNSIPDLPEEWASRNGAAAAAYLRYLNGLKLQRICPSQVVEAHAKQKGSVWNSIPPKPWWNRMGYVLKVVDRIAREMNVNEVEVISAYRAPAYNAHCAGARSGSWHQANVAADVKFPVAASKVTKMARELRDLGLFKGGVGGYWNFTHIDARGQNINW
jgi:hypothetical protein